MPTANRGSQAKALGKITQVIRILEMTLPDIGVETEVGKDVLKAMTTLSKHISPGSGSPGVENQALMNLMMQQKQEQPLLQLLRAQGQQQTPSPGGAPPPAAQAA